MLRFIFGVLFIGAAILVVAVYAVIYFVSWIISVLAALLIWALVIGAAAAVVGGLILGVIAVARRIKRARAVKRQTSSTSTALVVKEA
jgi:uncharacterized integral membrane protein